MSECWQEGDWRAYIDGELPVEQMAAASEHLSQCAACADLHRGISDRAARVSSMLLELDSAPVLSRTGTAGRSAWKWVPVGLAAAAVLAAAFVLAPKRRQPALEAPPAARALPAAPAMMQAEPAAIRPAAPTRRRRQAAKAQYFLALDDEPIDTGTVMRVALASGVEADVIVDGDGRPRAIRAIQ